VKIISDLLKLFNRGSSPAVKNAKADGVRKIAKNARGKHVYIFSSLLVYRGFEVSWNDCV
jgi:hypothetical protein